MVGYHQKNDARWGDISARLEGPYRMIPVGWGTQDRDAAGTVDLHALGNRFAGHPGSSQLREDKTKRLSSESHITANIPHG